MTVPCVLFLAVPFGATKAEMNLINFGHTHGHTARIYVKREKGVVKKFEVRLPATKAGKETSLGSRKTLEAALELRDAGEKDFQQLNATQEKHLKFQRDLLAAHNVSCHCCCCH